MGKIQPLQSPHQTQQIKQAPNLFQQHQKSLPQVVKRKITWWCITPKEWVRVAQHLQHTCYTDTLQGKQNHQRPAGHPKGQRYHPPEE